MEHLDSDFRKPINDGQPRGLNTGGLNAPQTVDRGEGTGGLSPSVKENRGLGTGGLIAPVKDPARGEGTGGLGRALVESVSAPERAPVAPIAPGPVERVDSYREQPQILRSLTVARGKKSTLRGQLEAALLGGISFALSFFDAIVTETAEASPAVSLEVNPGSCPGVGGAQPWESAGFRVRFDESGAAIVESVIGDSPAGRAGLQPLDVIAAIEDNGRPSGALELLRGWNKGLKWEGNRLLIERQGSGVLEVFVPKK